MCVIFSSNVVRAVLPFSTRNNDLLVVTELEIDTFSPPFFLIYTYRILSGGQVFFSSWKCQLRLDNTLHTSPCCGLQHKQSLFSVLGCWKGSLCTIFVFSHVGTEHKPSAVACFHVSHVTAVHDLTAQQIFFFFSPLEHVYSFSEILKLCSGLKEKTITLLSQIQHKKIFLHSHLI